MDIKPGTIIANYCKIERRISQDGGMALVYLATKLTDPKLKLVVKFARTGNDGPSHEDKLLERESTLLQKWDWRHPGIVRLYPIERDDSDAVYRLKALQVKNDPYFIVMEFLRGETLDKNIPAIKSYPLEWKLELFYQILQAVSFMHQKGYGHRDIKPANIVFRIPTSPDQIPQPVLIDFALACLDSDGSEIVKSSYTLEYVSPERFLSSTGMVKDMPLFARESDIWSLGVMFYEIITGEHLFKGSERSIRTTLIEGTFKSKIQDIYQARPMLSKFARWMLQEDPKKRPAIKELIYAIEETFPPPRIRVT